MPFFSFLAEGRVDKRSRKRGLWWSALSGLNQFEDSRSEVGNLF